MHPLIYLFYIYLIAGPITGLFFLILFSQLTLKIPRPNDLQQQKVAVHQAMNYAYNIPLEVIVISHYVGGVDFDMAYICELIDRSWETILRQGRGVLRERRMVDGWRRMRDPGDFQ